MPGPSKITLPPQAAPPHDAKRPGTQDDTAPQLFNKAWYMHFQSIDSQVQHLVTAAGTFSPSYRLFTTNATGILATDFTVESLSNSASTATLPDATTTPNQIFIFKAASQTVGTFTVSTVTGQNVDGATSYILLPGEYLMIQSDGSNWQVLGLGRATFSLAPNFRSFSGTSGILLTTDFAVESINTAAATLTVFAPAFSGPLFALKNSAASTNSLTVTDGGGKTFDGAASLILVPGAAAIIQGDGTNWIVLSKTETTFSPNFRSFNTASTSIISTDFTVEAINNSATTATLPSAIAVPNQIFVLKSSSSTVGVLTVATVSAQTIDGASTYALQPGESLMVQSDGAEWQVLQLSRATFSLSPNFRSFSGASSVLLTTDFAVESVNTGAATLTVFAPAFAGPMYALKNSSASTNSLTISDGGGKTFDGAGSIVLGVGGAAIIQGDGTNWIVLSQSGASSGFSTAAWPGYTPTIGNLTATSIIIARGLQGGKTAFVRLRVTGTTLVGGTNPTFTLPYSALDANQVFAATVTQGGSTVIGVTTISGSTVTVSLSNAALAGLTTYTFAFQGPYETT